MSTDSFPMCTYHINQKWWLLRRLIFKKKKKHLPLALRPSSSNDWFVDRCSVIDDYIFHKEKRQSSEKLILCRLFSKCFRCKLWIYRSKISEDGKATALSKMYNLSIYGAAIFYSFCFFEQKATISFHFIGKGASFSNHIFPNSLIMSIF